MSNISPQGPPPGWWLAGDGNLYPPERHPDPAYRQQFLQHAHAQAEPETLAGIPKKLLPVLTGLGVLSLLMIGFIVLRLFSGGGDDIAISPTTLVPGELPKSGDTGASGSTGDPGASGSTSQGSETTPVAGAFLLPADQFSGVVWSGEVLGIVPVDVGLDFDGTSQDNCWLVIGIATPTELGGAASTGSDFPPFDVSATGKDLLEPNPNECESWEANEAGYLSLWDLDAPEGASIGFYEQIKGGPNGVVEQIQISEDDVVYGTVDAVVLDGFPPVAADASAGAVAAPSGEPTFTYANDGALSRGETWAVDGEIFGLIEVPATGDDAELPVACWLVLGATTPSPEGSVEPNYFSEQEGVIWGNGAFQLQLIADGVVQKAYRYAVDVSSLDGLGYEPLSGGAMPAQRAGFWDTVCLWERPNEFQSVAIVSDSEVGPPMPISVLTETPVP